MQRLLRSHNSQQLATSPTPPPSIHQTPSIPEVPPSFVSPALPATHGGQPSATPATPSRPVDVWDSPTPATQSYTPNREQADHPTIREPNFNLEKSGRDCIGAATPWTKRLLQDAQFDYKTLLVTKQPFPEAEHLKAKFARES
ncbi:MAG TPA: hypothetical protein VGO47_11585, partial [Chlamydiales bacterium]|nr:hypothetical protein [Chlamydiales bacterium]